MSLNRRGFLSSLGSLFVLPLLPKQTIALPPVPLRGKPVWDVGMFYCPYVPLQTLKGAWEQPTPIKFKTRYGSN